MHPFRIVGREWSLLLDRIPIGTVPVAISTGFSRIFIRNVVTRLVEPAHGAAPLSEMSCEVIPSRGLEHFRHGYFRIIALGALNLG